MNYRLLIDDLSKAIKNKDWSVVEEIHDGLLQYVTTYKEKVGGSPFNSESENECDPHMTSVDEDEKEEE